MIFDSLSSSGKVVVIVSSGSWCIVGEITELILSGCCGSCCLSEEGGVGSGSLSLGKTLLLGLISGAGDLADPLLDQFFVL